MILYHGSNQLVTQPEIRNSHFFKDFGAGFYCTNSLKQAQQWAKRKSTTTGTPVVSSFEFVQNPTLSVKIFSSMTEEWLDFVAACRTGKPHSYDIVEGPMADDQIWNFVEDFIAGEISREAFWALAWFKKPTHQIVFPTERSLLCLKSVPDGDSL